MSAYGRRGRRVRHSRLSRNQLATAVAAGLVLAAATSRHPARPAAASSAAHGQAATAIAFARRQVGKPYLWGGTGPDAFDCSGLAQAAYAAAGVRIERTSQEQWASEPRVSSPAAGDLVFFAGGDGTPAAPGHVGIVTDPGRHLMIEAYAPGFPVRYSHYGTPASAAGDEDPVGFTDPAGSA